MARGGQTQRRPCNGRFGVGGVVDNDMIAKGTIIPDTRIAREMRSEETAQNVAAMAVALQWHVATNASDPVALATSRSTQTGGGEKDVLFVVCDTRNTSQEQGADPRTAADLARFILDAYHAREARSANMARTAADRADVAQWLADAVNTGLKRVSRETVALKATGTDGAPAATSREMAPSPYTVMAAVIHHDTLYVARYGGGQAYLLRAGTLQHLTDESFVSSAHDATLEADLGQLDLAGEDRVLLCNERLARTVNELQLRNVLRSTPSSRRAAQTLLDVSNREQPGVMASLAVADYVTGRTGVYPNAPTAGTANGAVSGTRRGTFRSILAIAALLVLIVGAIFVVSSISNGGLRTGSRTDQPTTPAATLFAVGPVTPTVAATALVTATNTPSPTASPTLSPTATFAPTETPTLTPTNTPEPTATETPTPTRRPTRRPTLTPTPAPTDTPAPTEPPTEVPTNTPIPTSPPSGGGEPPPPCPPGATCN